MLGFYPLLEKQKKMLDRKFRKGEVGEIMTWTVATIVVIFLLIFFTYLAMSVAKVKNIEVDELPISSEKGADYLSSKNSISLFLTDKNERTKVEQWMNDQGIVIKPLLSSK